MLLPDDHLSTELNCKLINWHKSVSDDDFFFLLEFSDHEKTHMHYHLRLKIRICKLYICVLSEASHVSCCCFAGHKVVVVRCEGINISGNFYRNKRKCALLSLLWSFNDCL